jgi:hypothetical protein
MKKGSLLLFLLAIFYSIHAQQFQTVRIRGSECANGHVIVKFKKDYRDDRGQDISARRQELVTKYKATVKKQWKIGAELWQVDTLQMKNATESIIDSLKRPVVVIVLASMCIQVTQE